MQPPYYPPGPPPPRPSSPWPVVLIVLACVGGVGILFVLIMAAILFPVFAQARESARSASCRSNLKQLSVALEMYAYDYDERYPPKETWSDSIQPYHKSMGLLRCPSDRASSFGYALNARLDRRRKASVIGPYQLPALYDSSLHTANGSDLLESFAPRHANKGNVTYADGHLERASRPPASDAGLAESSR